MNCGTGSRWISLLCSVCRIFFKFSGVVIDEGVDDELLLRDLAVFGCSDVSGEGGRVMNWSKESSSGIGGGGMSSSSGKSCCCCGGGCIPVMLLCHCCGYG